MPSIGVLDSGVGGLSVLREVHRLLPDHPTLYVADQAHVPYGPRSHEDIHTCVDAIVRVMLGQGAAVIVLACHAASAASLYRLREQYPSVPFVGIEPAVKPAVEHSRTRVVGVLTTQATADGPLYHRVVRRFGGDAQIVTQIAPDLVTSVEAGCLKPESLRHHVRPLLDAGADEIVLACTHFPFLLPALRAMAGPEIEIVDPGLAVARQVGRVWPEGLAPGTGPHRYLTSGDPTPFRRIIRMLLGIDVDVEQL